ncbi:unnamed protein product [Arabidopsis thaliana]|uniref:Uncharacterized protein n=1 Tax=Arabidopsis thaliana TaxID=3702 RepID=Q9LH01_ARATH|nr:unnamed protein product [Arabidopsis thaliana]
MFQVDREASPSFPVSILESFLITSKRMASLDDVESETGVEGVRMMESPVIEIEEEEVELIQAPVPNFFMDDYVLIESELAQAGTRWEDYVVLPNSPVSMLVGAETAFNLVSSSDDDGDQIVPSTPVMTPIVPSFAYPTLPDSPLTSLWRDYDRIRHGDTIETEVGVPSTLAPTL